MKLSIREEDYLETIYRLGRDQIPVRISDIARERGVTLPTVVSAVSRLKKMGMISQSYYGRVTLNAAGKRAASEIYGTHKLLCRLFRDILHLSPKAAEENACRLEHGLDAEAIKRLAFLVNSICNCPGRGDGCLSGFADAFESNNRGIDHQVNEKELFRDES